MQKRNISCAITFITCFIFCHSTIQAQRQMEALGRGVVAVRTSEKQVFISWRLLGTEPAGTAFNIYRKVDAKSPVRLNTSPLTAVTYYIDSLADLSLSTTWLVKRVLNGKEEKAGSGEFALPANTPVRAYLSIPLQLPPAATIMNQAYTFSANDASAGDLDGDGEYEIILK